MKNWINVAFSNYQRKQHFCDHPFPHIVIENALTYEQCERARKDYADLPVWRDNYPGNFRTDYLYKEDYTQYFNRLCEEFNQTWLKQNKVSTTKFKFSSPNGVSSLCTLSKYKQDVITKDDSRVINSDKMVNAMIPHRDVSTKVFVTLLYLPEENDNLKGDLEIYEGPAVYGDKQKVDSYDGVNCVKTIEYSSASMVIFENSPKALHAVAERLPGVYTRTMMCLTFDTKDKRWTDKFYDTEER